MVILMLQKFIDFMLLAIFIVERGIWNAILGFPSFACNLFDFSIMWNNYFLFFIF